MSGLVFIAAVQATTRADDHAAAVAKSVTIKRDAFGVPHVYAPTDAACVFGFIYAQAEDYFWQIEDSYLRSLGRAAEVYGDKSLADDLVNRRMEIPRLSKEEYQCFAENESDLPGGRRWPELLLGSQSAGQAPVDHAF